MRPPAALLAAALLLLTAQPVAATLDPHMRVDLPDQAAQGRGAPVQEASPAPTLELVYDLPAEANAGEVILVTLYIHVLDGGTVRNVTVEADVDDAYIVLPSWRHDAWRGGDLAWHLDEVDGSASVFFHVQAPADLDDVETSFGARAATTGDEATTARDVTVRPASDPDASRAPTMAVVAAGYVATLTAPPLPDGVLA